jgi:probable rRNA maturation factor
MAPAMLRVSVSDGAGGAARAPGLGAWLARTAPRRVRGEVAVALVGDRRMRTLNRRYRGVDRATDVLSFAAGSHPRSPADAADAADAADGGPPGPFLGDVVIATGVAARQARAEGHAIGTEYRILALHGLLHLMGYDHETDGGRMARAERRLRRRGGLDRGLLERSRGRVTR